MRGPGLGGAFQWSYGVSTIFCLCVLARNVWGEETYYLNSPHQKLVRVEDPVSKFVEETVFRWVDGASADGILVLEPCNNGL